YNAECYELIEAVAPAASLRADYGRSLSRLQRRLTALNQFFDFLLPLPDLDIARDVNQLQVHLVEDRSGTVAFIHQAVDRALEHEIRSRFLAQRFDGSRLHEDAFELFHKGLGIELLMSAIQHRA